MPAIGRGGRQRTTRGQDYDAQVDITLEEAYHGTTRLVSKDGRRLQVKIPSGAKTGTKVRLAGEGGAGAGGAESGDLTDRQRGKIAL
jgi:DnaJ-class molecular chaperone